MKEIYNPINVDNIGSFKQSNTSHYFLKLDKIFIVLFRKYSSDGSKDMSVFGDSNNYVYLNNGLLIYKNVINNVPIILHPKQIYFFVHYNIVTKEYTLKKISSNVIINGIYSFIQNHVTLHFLIADNVYKVVYQKHHFDQIQNKQTFFHEMNYICLGDGTLIYRYAFKNMPFIYNTNPELFFVCRNAQTMEYYLKNIPDDVGNIKKFEKLESVFHYVKSSDGCKVVCDQSNFNSIKDHKKLFDNDDFNVLADGAIIFRKTRNGIPVLCKKRKALDSNDSSSPDKNHAETVISTPAEKLVKPTSLPITSSQSNQNKSNNIDKNPYASLRFFGSQPLTNSSTQTAPNELSNSSYKHQFRCGIPLPPKDGM